MQCRKSSRRKRSRPYIVAVLVALLAASFFTAACATEVERDAEESDGSSEHEGPSAEQLGGRSSNESPAAKRGDQETELEFVSPPLSKRRRKRKIEHAEDRRGQNGNHLPDEQDTKGHHGAEGDSESESHDVEKVERSHDSDDSEETQDRHKASQSAKKGHKKKGHRSEDDAVNADGPSKKRRAHSTKEHSTAEHHSVKGNETSENDIHSSDDAHLEDENLHGTKNNQNPRRHTSEGAHSEDEIHHGSKNDQNPERGPSEVQIADGKKKKPTVSSVEREEEKVQVATLKLVKWLRNRLRKRLNEVADLETAKATTDHAIANLAESQKRVSEEREHVIVEKRARQNELAEFRRTADVPDNQLRIVREQSAKMEHQLEDLGHVYDGLATKLTQMEVKLREEGFSHWLDTRGTAYMPETAVGVLAKSAEVLSPVASSIETAVAVEQQIAKEFDSLLPEDVSPVVPGVVSDVLVLAPVIPVVALVGRLSCSMHGLTVLHYIVYLSAVFAAQSGITFLCSLALGSDAIEHYQKTNEPVLIAMLFLTAGMYTWFVFMHTLLAIAHTTRRNVVHLCIVCTIGYMFYHLVFQPAVLDRHAGLPMLAPCLLALVFLFLMTERNEVLQLALPLQAELRAFFTASRSWAAETVDAMRVALVGDVAGPLVAAVDLDIDSEFERDAARARHPAAYYGQPRRSLAMGSSRSSAVGPASVAHPRRFR